MVERNASDLHITAGSPPVIRINGRLERLADLEKLSGDETRDLVYRIVSTEQQKHLETRRQLDFSYSVPGLARFRVNAYFQRAAIGAAFRMIPAEIKTLEELAMPERLYELGEKPRGLILVTGPTGSGKSTSLAAMVDRINETRSEHILTIEDPIEFLHWHRSCIVNQREIGVDATSFGDGLRAALRQDPDVILVGEMRDLETIATVLTADGRGRIAALEILFPDDAVRNLIRQAKIEQVYSVMQTNTELGMQTMEQSLSDLVLRGIVTPQAAFSRTTRRDQLLSLLERGGMTGLDLKTVSANGQKALTEVQL